MDFWEIFTPCTLTPWVALISLSLSKSTTMNSLVEVPHSLCSVLLTILFKLLAYMSPVIWISPYFARLLQFPFSYWIYPFLEYSWYGISMIFFCPSLHYPLKDLSAWDSDLWFAFILLRFFLGMIEADHVNYRGKNKHLRHNSKSRAMESIRKILKEPMRKTSAPTNWFVDVNRNVSLSVLC